MIIDCHGHYTTVPPHVAEWRQRQIASVGTPFTEPLVVSDDEIRETIEGKQLKFQQERGTDLTIFSPRASAMAHHYGDGATSMQWTREVNDLIYRITQMFPDNFVGVCQLPQSPGVSPAECIAELERCVNELGFIGCNLNPDPTDGYWTGPELTTGWWYPLYEKMEELEAPAMIHVSMSCNPNFQATGAHYIAADTTAFMQLLMGDLFKDFPKLRIIIPHGGGAVPYHWGRYRGMAADINKPWPDDMMGDNVFFDTCVYHQAGINLLFDVVPHKNILFGSEMIGAVRGLDPETGRYYDDTKPYVDAVPGLSDVDKQEIFAGNTLSVFPRLKAQMEKAGKL